MAAVAPTNTPRMEMAVAEDETGQDTDVVDHDVVDTDVLDDEQVTEQEPEGVDESGPDLPVMPVAPLTDQFPAVDGTMEGRHAEVAQRSTDGSDGDTFYKVVSVSGATIADDHPMHRANAAGVLQEAIQRGLHPRGDVYLVDKVEHDEPLNATGTRRSQYTDLRYAVQVIPASIDTGSQP